jgi:hypothetical protein
VHAQVSGAAQPFASMADEANPLPGQTGFVLHLSYQQPPSQLIRRAAAGEFRLTYCSVVRGAGDAAAGIIYIDPHWPLADGCVNVPGYAIPILPASGVVQACIYWSIVEHAESH